MEYLPYSQVIESISYCYRQNLPFLFAIDFKKSKGFCFQKAHIPDSIKFYVDTKHSFASGNPSPTIHYYPISIDEYQAKFDQVKKHLLQGNSYLCNLTQPTRIELSIPLEELFEICQAPYKLWVKNEFLVFSPETFVIIEGDTISTFPMKGTADASDPHGLTCLLNNPKEHAEHNTIVDLLRNDLSIVANKVIVNRLKYTNLLNTHRGPLWQMSSEISGIVKPYFKTQMGELFDKMLPAGSISGAPKVKTLQIIEEVEAYSRNFYTGIFGYYNGIQLISAVMIRFIEENQQQLYYKSGGGITASSILESEYHELLRKIYVPIF